eukprot:scaffold19400_cov63-Phaeocystis_antarctica.AAC.7
MIVHVLFVPVQPATSNAAAPTLASAPQNRPGGRGTVVTVGARRPRSVQRHARRSTRQRSLQQRNGDARAFSAPAALRASPESTGLAVTPVGARAAGADSAGRDSGSHSNGDRSGRGGGSGGGSAADRRAATRAGGGWYWHGGGRSSDLRGSGDGGDSAPPTAVSMALTRVSAREFGGVGTGGTRANSEKRRHRCTVGVSAPPAWACQD